VIQAWPSTKQLYLWSFFAVAAGLLAHIVFLLYRDRDRTAALLLGQSIPAASSGGESRGASAGH
jgi:hypothetical protein